MYINGRRGEWASGTGYEILTEKQFALFHRRIWFFEPFFVGYLLGSGKNEFEIKITFCFSASSSVFFLFFFNLSRIQIILYNRGFQTTRKEREKVLVHVHWIMHGCVSISHVLQWSVSCWFEKMFDVVVAVERAEHTYICIKLR